MKKILLLGILITLVQVCEAQQESKPRNYIIGGSINFLTQINSYPFGLSRINLLNGGTFSSSTRDSKYLQFGLSSYIGRRLNDNWILGGQLNYSLYSSKYAILDLLIPSNMIKYENREHQYGIGIFGRYTLNPQHRFNFYLLPYADFSFFINDLSSNSISVEQTSGKNIDIGINCGVLYNLNDKFRLNVRMGGINYINGNWKSERTNFMDTSNNFSSLGFNFSFSRILFGAETMF